MKATVFIGIITVSIFTQSTPAAEIASYPPASMGGISRWSQLWQDPGPNGNDLDGDSVCWSDFVSAWPVTIDHIEWWGEGASELGFQIEFWRQDPNTIAYQPLGVFYYGGDHTVRPEARFRIAPGEYSESADPSGVTRFGLDLTAPVNLPENTVTNVRWFIAVIGLTQRAYYTWNWSQGLSASSHTFQFIRGGTTGGGSLFRALEEARAVFLAGTIHEPPRVRVDLIAPKVLEVAWPIEQSGYTLHQCAGVPTPAWTVVTNKVTETINEFIVQISISETANYFQLKK